MKAGIELDALVAEKVMGWRCCEATGNNTMGSEGGCVFFIDPETYAFLLKRRDIQATEKRGDFDNAPRFSTNIAAAWKVVEKLRETVFSVTFAVEPGTCCCDILRNEGDHSAIAEYADSAPLAICLAALKTCGVEIPA